MTMHETDAKQHIFICCIYCFTKIIVKVFLFMRSVCKLFVYILRFNKDFKVFPKKECVMFHSSMHSRAMLKRVGIMLGKFSPFDRQNIMLNN